jgi:hypothetical protein
MKNQLFFRTLKKVKADFIGNDMPTPVRVLILEDESRVEIPTDGTVFVFDTNRFVHIKQQMEKEAGQKIPT